MENQKLENLLNLALEATPDEREQSPNLRVGYNSKEETWELIARYAGDLSPLLKLGVRVEPLLAGYAILTAPQETIAQLARLVQITYIEKPKRLYFAAFAAKAASCLSQLQTGNGALSGRGTAVAIIDSGIDYFHPDFQNADGTSRILKLWDQPSGRVYTREEINAALRAGSREAGLALVNSVDVSGHGTAVAGIAAGNGRAGGERYRGVAWESDLFVVRLGNFGSQGFFGTTQLMRGVDGVVREAMALGIPTAINLSFGNTYGSHDGSSLLETYLDDVSNIGRVAIVVGTGNEGSGAGHTSGVLRAGEETRVELSVGAYQTGFGVQLWKSYADEFEVSVIAPSGESTGPLRKTPGNQTFILGGTKLLVYYGMPSPYSISQEIYLDFLGQETYVESGIWVIRFRPIRLVTGEYDLWLPVQNVLSADTRFLAPKPDTTLTIPATAAHVISVGAYNDALSSYADFSGRGFLRRGKIPKPDLVAPGVGIVAPRAGGGYEAFTGTSFATPFVSGAASLLMEWGMVRGNDPFLYGEKLKAYLIRGARPFPGMTTYPNPMVGYGALCVKQSIPGEQKL